MSTFVKNYRGFDIFYINGQYRVKNLEVRGAFTIEGVCWLIDDWHDFGVLG